MKYWHGGRRGIAAGEHLKSRLTSDAGIKVAGRIWEIVDNSCRTARGTSATPDNQITVSFPDVWSIGTALGCGGTAGPREWNSHDDHRRESDPPGMDGLFPQPERAVRMLKQPDAERTSWHLCRGSELSVNAVCPGAGLSVSASAGERARCPYCGHLIAVTAGGKFRKHNGRRASAPPKRLTC
jgi:DNA-directed RNA polymerase subunit RPC12/RpoP